MNKKLVGVLIGISVVLVILASVSLYTHTKTPQNPSKIQQSQNVTASNQSGIQQPTNTTQPKPAVGRHIVVELNESLSVASR